jgi:hypothetical protein
MCILQGKGLGMQVSDNLSPSPYKYISTQHLTPSSPNSIPNSQIHSSIHIYTLVTVEHVQAQYMIPSLLNLSLVHVGQD